MWYGVRYPTLEDLEAYAWDLGSIVVFSNRQKGIYFPPDTEAGAPAVLGIPDHSSMLAKAWSLAHELGHLVLHLGYASPWTRAKQETQAERWAAGGLIPEARIQKHGNACTDSMIAALSAHYEDLPLIDCDARRLAGKIAKIRLATIKGVT